MPRNEDYLDSLLDSIVEKEAKNVSAGSDKGHSEAHYLREFENELMSGFEDDDPRGFLKDFDRELAMSGDLDSHDDFDHLGFLAEEAEGGEDPFGSVDDLIKMGKSEEAEDDLLDSLTGILNSAGSDGSAPAAEPDVSPAQEAYAPEAAKEASDPEAAPEEDSGFMSDIEDESEEAAPETEAAPEAAPEAEGEAAGENPDALSEDEVMDISNLLDSIDEEGNLEVSEKQEASLVDEQGNPVTDEAETIEGEIEEKQGFFAKLLAKLFKKKDKPEEEEEEETSGSAESDEPAVDKKALKKEEKERKKKEKEEAKKKAKEEKEKKAKEAKEKAPKEKKPKKEKAPDKSPKIPIKILLLFLLLSVSLVVLYFVFQKTFSYTVSLSTAQSNFDHGDYLEAYEALNGVEIKEDDAIFYQRARLMGILDLRYKTYEIYVVEGKEIIALDALIRGVVYYRENISTAGDLGIPSEYNSFGRTLVTALSDRYAVSEDEAWDLLKIRERREYTKQLYYVLERQGLWEYVKDH